MRVADRRMLATEGLEQLIQALWAHDYEVVGPQAKDGAIVYDTIRSASELPRDVADEQEAGRYRLKPRGDGLRFGYAVGPHSWKRFLHPPLLTLWRARRSDTGFELLEDERKPPRYAFVGVRACELRAIAIQDRVLLDAPHSDPGYRARRQQAFVVAVNCGEPASTCFCSSMNAGPRVAGGFDLALTELASDGGSRFLLEIGSERGAALAAELETRPASEQDLAAAEAVLAQAEARIGRRLEQAGLKQLLAQHYDDPHWDEVAKRCLTCANCTLVCPTCFCTAVDDVSDLTGSQAERRRRWDSCFTLDFSYIHGGSVRTSAGARYRQWLTHKLGTWQDQFGTSGCVGCGRCITWCPVGIDITAEVAALASAAGRQEATR
jgi:ferredoxin